MKIKSLKWQYPEYHKGCMFADTILGRYTVWEIDGGYLQKPGAINGFRAGDNIEEAKYAAQKEFDFQIREQLDIECEEVYMCKTDYDFELGASAGGNKVYASITDLDKCRPCAKGCGIVKVQVSYLETVREEAHDEENQ